MDRRLWPLAAVTTAVLLTAPSVTQAQAPARCGGQSFTAYFLRTSADLNPTAANTIDSAVIAAKMTKGAVTVVGHIDGSEQSQAELSAQRAAAVVKQMTEGGIAAGQITSSGVGFTRPLVDRPDSEARNRRAEICVAG